MAFQLSISGVPQTVISSNSTTSVFDVYFPEKGSYTLYYHAVLTCNFLEYPLQGTTVTKILDTHLQVPNITFNGTTLVGILNKSILLQNIFITNSSGKRTYNIAGSTAASISGTRMYLLDEGIVTVTGTLEATTLYQSASKSAVFTIVGVDQSSNTPPRYAYYNRTRSIHPDRMLPGIWV